MCLISLNDLKALNSKTLIFLTTEEYDLPYLENSHKIIVPESTNDLIFELRHMNIENFPVVFYDDEDLSLASTAYFIFEAMEWKSLVLVASRGSSKNVRPLADLKKNQNISHIDLSKISNSVYYERQEYTLNAPVVPSICFNLSPSSVELFLLSQNIPVKTNEIQLTGFYAEAIGTLLRYLGNNVSVLLTEVRTRFRTIASKGNDVFFSIADSEYFDAEEENRTKKTFRSSLKEDPRQSKSTFSSKRKEECQEMVATNKVKHYENTIEPAKPKEIQEFKAEKRCICLVF